MGSSYPGRMDMGLCVALLAVVTLSAAVRACAPAPRYGKHVQTLEESAVIVWDAAARTEHFIRRAAFQGDTSDFGFLVPTPTVPRLAEAHEEVFEFLEERTRPAVVEHKQTGFVLSSYLFGRSRAANERAASVASRSPAVRVLASQRVAGYDAVVLEADRADALNGWLKSHGYASRPALVGWLTPYVAAHWKITAFKIAAKEASSGPISTSAVRMSFKTDRPLFPYSEPEDQRTGKGAPTGRSLRIFFLASERMAGVKGQGPSSTRLNADTEWAGAMDGDYPSRIASKLRLAPTELPTKLWMTVFEDRSDPRPGTDDVFFERSADTTPVIPSPIINEVDNRVGIPVELVGFGIMVAIGIGWRLSQRHRPPRNQSRGA